MEKKSSSTWSVIIKVVIALASALAGVFGLNSCMK
nr:smalltalk protein [Bacteroides intestinalis]